MELIRGDKYLKTKPKISDSSSVIAIFSHPDFTVGTGFSPVQPAFGRVADCVTKVTHRRYGISPNPEDKLWDRPIAEVGSQGREDLPREKH